MKNLALPNLEARFLARSLSLHRLTYAESFKDCSLTTFNFYHEMETKSTELKISFRTFSKTQLPT
jgi:hypothetical protein